MFEEAGQIISEQAANEAEGDEEDLLEGLDEEDIQHLVNLSREMKSEYERTDETGSRGRRVKRFEKMNGRGSWEAMGGTPKGSEPDTVRGWRDPFQEPDERAGTDTMKPKPKHDPRGQRRRQKRQK
jgi:hypothetical protein